MRCAPRPSAPSAPTTSAPPTPSAPSTPHARHAAPHTLSRCSSRGGRRSHPSLVRRPRRSPSTTSPKTMRSRSVSPLRAASAAWSDVPPRQRHSAEPPPLPPVPLLHPPPQGGSRRRSTPKGRGRRATRACRHELAPAEPYAFARAGKVSFGRVIAPDQKNFLACARSIGDGRFKANTPLGAHLPSDLVPATPDVASHALVPDDRFVVLASDGVSRPRCNPGCNLCGGRRNPAHCRLHPQHVLQAAPRPVACCNPTRCSLHPHSPSPGMGCALRAEGVRDRE